MPESPYQAGIDNVAVEVDLEGSPLKDEYAILSVEVQSALFKVPTATVDILLPFAPGDDESFAGPEEESFAPGAEINIKVGYHSQTESVFKGIIVRMGVRSSAHEGNVLSLYCSDKACKMTLGRTSAYYKDMKDSAIISSLIGNHGLSSEVDSTDYKHTQLIQYHAVDWDFVMSRAEVNGLLLYAEDGTVKVKKPEVSGSPDLVVTYGNDVYAFRADVEARDQMPSVKAHAWDPGTQDLVEGTSSEPTINAHGNITGKKLSEVPGLSDYELHTTGPVEKTMLTAWASGHLLRARLSAMRGTVSFIGNSKPKLNTLIQIKGFGARFNGDALISGVSHTVKKGAWETTVDFGLTPAQLAQLQPDINTPPAGGLLPAIRGLQNGTVKKIDADPDGALRVQVNVPVIDTAGDGIWARLANFYATDNKGSFFIPEVGDEVVLGFLNEDPRYPVILGSLYGKKIKGPYTPDKDNSIKAFVSKNDLKIEFQDKDKVLTVSTPAGNEMVFSDKDKSITLKDQNGNKIEMTSSGITIDSAKDINIKAKGKVNIEGATGVSAKASGGDATLEGLNVSAKASISFSAEGSASAELKAAGNTTVKGAMVMIN